MREIGVSQARTHLSSLIRDVAAGEEVLITRRGKPVARLPAVFETRRTTPEAIAALLDFQRRLDATSEPDPGFDWKAARDEGRP